MLHQMFLQNLLMVMLHYHISLTAIISLISIISVPFIVFNSINYFGIDNVSKDISMTGIALKMFFQHNYCAGINWNDN